MKQTRERVLLEFKVGSISPTQLEIMEQIIYMAEVTKGAECLPFFIEEDNSCLLLIKASKEKEI